MHTGITFVHTTNANPPITTQSLDTGTPDTNLEVMYDIVTPGWMSLVKLGKILNNPVSRKKVVRLCVPRTLEFVQTLPPPSPNATKDTYTGEIGAYWDRYIADTRFVEADLFSRSKALQLAAISARQRVNPVFIQGITTLVEFPKTIKMIAEAVRSLRTIRKNIVKGNLGGALAALGTRAPKGISASSWLKKSANDRWLELRYGWGPMVYDVQGAMKALNPEREFHVRGTARGKFTNNATKVTDVIRDNTWYGKWTIRFEQTETLEARAYVLYTADLAFQSVRDFGLTELPLTAWELVPYSFVVDWFVNVGDWLEAVTPKLGVKILAEGTVLKRTSAITRTRRSWVQQTVSGNSYAMGGTFLGSSDSQTTTEYIRTPGFGDLLSYPPVNVKLNVKRAVDAIALLRIAR